MSNSRNSRYVCGNVSFSAIAKMAHGQVVCLALNPDENDARAGTATQVYVRGYERAPAGQGANN